MDKNNDYDFSMLQAVLTIGHLISCKLFSQLKTTIQINFKSKSS